MLLLLGNSPNSGAGITGIMRGLRHSERFAFSLISNLAEISIPGIIFIVLSGILEPFHGISMPVRILIWLGFFMYAALWATLFTFLFRSRLTYYRDNNGREIDLMIMENGILYPIEIKKSADPGKDALKNFNVLKSLPNEIGAGAVICLSPVMIPLDKQNKIIPIGMI